MLNDLRFAFRTLLKDRGYAAVVVLTLALGIGVNTMIFSAFNAILFRIGPFSDADRLVRIYRASPHGDRDPHSVANVLDYQEQNRVFSPMAAFYWSSLALAGDGQLPERVSALSVTGDFFGVLGVAPLLGRTLLPVDDQSGNDRVVVLSHGLWQRRFGGDTNILGRAIRADGKSLTVVGVMPAPFDLRRLWGPVEAWTPAAFGADEKRDRSHHYLAAIARLKPGVSLRQAQVGLSTIADRLAQQHPRDNAGDSVRVLNLVKSASDRTVWSVSYFLFATTGFVLLIACVNVANLQLARITIQQHEVAIRAALGAGRMRLIRQFLTESLLLAALGGGLGLMLASWGADLFGARITIPEAKYSNATQRIAFYRQAFERLAALPGVQGVGAITALPIWGTGGNGSFLIEGQPRPASGHLPRANWDMVNPQLFATLGLTVKHGRPLTDADHETAPPVAVVNATLARQYWPNENPVGKRFSRGDPELNDWAEIVGVVSDVRYPANYDRSEARPQIYESLWQRTRGGTAVLLRTTVTPESLADAVRQAVASIDPDLPVSDVVTFERAVGREVANLQLATQLLGGFALLGLLLAGLGIYGVVSYSVAQRTNEIGLRLALGAQPADVLRMVVRQGMGLVVTGVALGLAGAFALALAMRGLLHGVSAVDPTTFGVALTGVAGVALLACWFPARRAAKLDPMVALRCE